MLMSRRIASATVLITVFNLVISGSWIIILNLIKTDDVIAFVGIFKVLYIILRICMKKWGSYLIQHIAEVLINIAIIKQYKPYICILRKIQTILRSYSLYSFRIINVSHIHNHMIIHFFMLCISFLWNYKKYNFLGKMSMLKDWKYIKRLGKLCIGLIHENMFFEVYSLKYIHFSQ